VGERRGEEKKKNPSINRSRATNRPQKTNPTNDRERQLPGDKDVNEKQGASVGARGARLHEDIATGS